MDHMHGGRHHYADYPRGGEEEEITDGEAFVVCVIVSTCMLVPIHYLVALVAWVIGKKIPINPLKVIPAYTALLATGFGTIWAVDELNT